MSSRPEVTGVELSKIIGTRRRTVVGFVPWPLSPEKETVEATKKRFGEAKSRFECGTDKKITFQTLFKFSCILVSVS